MYKNIYTYTHTWGATDSCSRSQFWETNASRSSWFNSRTSVRTVHGPHSLQNKLFRKACRTTKSQCVAKFSGWIPIACNSWGVGTLTSWFSGRTSKWVIPCIYTCKCIYISTQEYTPVYVYIYMCIHTYIYIHKCAYVYVYIYLYILKCTYICRYYIHM